MTSLKTRLLVAAAAVVAFPVVPALAAVENVTVTAQKREESLQEVPISLEVVSGENLAAFQIRDLESLQNYVPNLLVQGSPGNDAIFIRGFGSQAANYAFDQSVSIYLDGIYGGRNRQFMAPFFDIERVEVMRGPQGALLGKNTAAGAISIITANPTDEYEGRVTATYNFDRAGVEASGYASGPLTEDFGVRLALKYTDMPGWIDNSSTGTEVPHNEDKLGRATLRWKPDSGFDMTAKIEHGVFSTEGTHQVQVGVATKTSPPDKKAASGFFGVSETDESETWNLSLTTNIAMNDHTLTLITGWSTFEDIKNVGGCACDPSQWLSDFTEDFEQFSQEIRLLSPTGQTFEYIIGAYYDSSDYHQFNGSEYVDLLGLAFFDGRIHHDFNQSAETWSVFGMGTYHFTENLRLVASARYTWNSKDGTFVQVVDYGVPLSGPKSLAGSISEENFDPSLTVQFDLTEDVMLYASYGAGSKAGGFVAQRGATPTTFTFNPETSENYELGMKSTLLDGSLVLNLALYQTKFDDLQVSFYDPSIPGFITGNAAAATSQGVEGMLAWQATDELSFISSVAYLDASYDDFPGAACPVTAPPGCLPATNNLAGFVLPGASKWTGNIRGIYEVGLPNGLNFGLTGVAYFRSGYYIASDYSRTYGWQEGWWKFDARAEITSDDGRWGIALIGKNLTDEHTSNFAYLWPLQPPPVGINFLEETRSIAIEGTVRF